MPRQGRRMRKHALETFGRLPHDCRRVFDERFGAGEHTLYAGHYDPYGILIIDARFDSCIPPAPWKVTGHPRRMALLSSRNSVAGADAAGVECRPQKHLPVSGPSTPAFTRK